MLFWHLHGILLYINKKNKEKHILYLSCTDSNDIWNLGQVSFHFNCQQQNPITFLI